MRVSDLDIDRIYVDQLSRPQDYGVLSNHFHCYYELFYVRQGKCTFLVNNKLVDVNPGEILIIPPREVHYNKYPKDTIRTVIYFRGLDISEKGVPTIPSFKENYLQMQTVHIPSSYRPVIEAILDNMLKEESINDKNTGSMLQLLLKQFFLSCNRYCTFRHNDSGLYSTGAEDMLTATHYIADNYNHPVTLEEVAAIVNLSPSYLSKKFHQTTGKTLREYLNSERLKHAAKELIGTSHSITEIAINSGFSDGNYFKDVFKKTFGCSPREYRKLREKVYQKDKVIKNPEGHTTKVNKKAANALNSK